MIFIISLYSFGSTFFPFYKTQKRRKPGLVKPGLRRSNYIALKSSTCVITISP